MRNFFAILLPFAACVSCMPGQSADKQDKSAIEDTLALVHQADTITPEVEPEEDLSVYFTEDKSSGYTQIQAKSVPAGGNGVYCYFRLKGKKASGMRMHIQYWEDKYANVDYYSFNVDGKTYKYMANRNRSTLGDARVVQGSIFYWYDDSVNKTDQAFLEALGSSKNATISLIDRATNTAVGTITISEQVKKDIRRTFEYYFSLDGSLIPRAGMVNIRD